MGLVCFDDDEIILAPQFPHMCALVAVSPLALAFDNIVAYRLQILEQTHL